MAGQAIFAFLLMGVAPAGYTGPETCALCHRAIADTQTKTPMAETWHGRLTPSLPERWSAHATDGGLAVDIRRVSDHFEYSTAMPDGSKVTLPVEVIMGGERHGLGFLPRIDQLGGITLERPVLLQARYSWSLSKKRLLIAPNEPVETPHSYATALGLVLSPSFETKCLVCHGKPGTMGAGKAGGVHCESCHGPGWTHLQALAKGKPREGILNPQKLTVDQRLAVCAPCHTGFSRQTDPLPDELLVSNQVNAFTESECFIQSGKAFQCTTCHDPHRDSSHDIEASVKACVGCHSANVSGHAAVCPVNASSGCTGCHMPAIERGPFHLVDHWIRVHPGEQAGARQGGEKSQVRPRREFLRAIAAKSQAEAEAARQRLAKGEPFFDVARAVSVDDSAPIGGYWGARWLDRLDAPVRDAAAALSYGETSGVIAAGGRWLIVQRMARDFRLDAARLQEQAAALGRQGDRKGAIEKCQEALKIDPHFLPSLLFLGKALSESGNAVRAVSVLKAATRIYPQDADAQFDLGLILGRMGKPEEEMAAYRRAIELEPDLVAAYVSLGKVLFSRSEWTQAGEVFRQGLRINPLTPDLNYGLGRVLERLGDEAGAKKALALADKIALRP
ncbi:MAG: tetratricopeptide repeat protein [Bryobacteraceae bacterium]